MQFYTVLSILAICTATVTCKHHKKKNQGGFLGSVTSLYEDFVPKISHHLLKFAVNKLSDHEHEVEEEQDHGGPFLGNLIGGFGGGKEKHHHHQKKGHKEVVYKPVYVGNDYYGGYNGAYHDTPSYGGLYNNYQPVPNGFHGDFSSGLDGFNRFDEYNFHHLK